MELDQKAFRRLVQLYLGVELVGFGVIGVELFTPKLWAFSDDFDRLVQEYFGATNDAAMFTALAFGVVSLTTGIASTVGLLWFKRWARTGFWLSILIALPLLLVPGFWLTYSTVWSDVLGFIASALFGAILLLSYSSNHGQIWFNQATATEGNM